MAALMVAAEEKERLGIQDLQRPQVQYTLLMVGLWFGAIDQAYGQYFIIKTIQKIIVIFNSHHKQYRKLLLYSIVIRYNLHINSIQFPAIHTSIEK